MIMKNKTGELLKKLYLRKELIPDFCSVVLVLFAMMIVPLFYNQISTKGVRVILTLLIFVAAVVATVLTLIRFAKRNKSSDKFDWLRFVLCCLAILILTFIIASITSKFGISNALGESSIYPHTEKDNKWLAVIINCFAFAFFSQVLFTSISAGYDEMHVFFNKLIKTLVYIGIPMFLLMLLATFITTKVFAVGFILTIILWFTAISANEIIDTEWSLLDYIKTK